MPSLTSWKVPPAAQPRAEDFSFDLDRVLAAVVGLHAIVPPDAFTAETLGTERSGNGVVIEDGLILTIGYLITEAQTVWLHLRDGRVVEGHTLGIDPDTGFGLVQALGPLDLPALPLGSSAAAKPGDRVLVGGVGGPEHSVAAYIVAKQEFAGYWEYLLDEAIFTTPSHPNWGGTALISEHGEVIGIGSLQIEREQGEQDDSAQIEHLNMMVPIDLLKPILADLKEFGRVRKAPRPWLGLYAAEIDEHVVVVGVTPKAPAARAELQPGDLILGINGQQIDNCADLYRKLWALGPAGVTVPLTLYRGGDTFDVELVSSDRFKVLKKPRLH
jgi:S1-C subfamily serine protease